MSVKITVTVEATGSSHIEIIRTYEGGSDNPRYYGDYVRHETAELGEKIAEQFDRLVGDPIRRITPFGCKCICQEAPGSCNDCGHLGCGGRR